MGRGNGVRLRCAAPAVHTPTARTCHRCHLKSSNSCDVAAGEKHRLGSGGEARREPGTSRHRVRSPFPASPSQLEPSSFSSPLQECPRAPGAASLSFRAVGLSLSLAIPAPHQGCGKWSLSTKCLSSYFFPTLLRSFLYLLYCSCQSPR